MIQTMHEKVDTAYEPYCSIVRWIILDKKLPSLNTLNNDYPDAVDAFSFDNGSFEIRVHCFNFSNLDEAREYLIKWMDRQGMTFKVSTVTDFSTNHEFDAWNAFSDVNSQSSLDKDQTS